MKKKINKKPITKKPIVKKLKTDKEKKLLNLIMANSGKTRRTKSIEAMMLEAGYARNTARQQKPIIDKIKQTKEYKNYIERLIAHRDKIIELMEEKAPRAEYRDLSSTLARVENIVLLAEGKPTSNINIISEEEKEKLDNLFDENS